MTVLSADAVFFSEDCIANFEPQDESTGKKVTAAARRILAKDFEVTDIIRTARKVERFPWGRSSEGAKLFLQYEIRFGREDGSEFVLIVREDRFTEITSRNPHDRWTGSRKPDVSFLPLNKETKAALGM